MRLEVGKVDKAHGIHGEVIVSLLSDRTERLRVGSVFHHDGGVFTVAQSRPHQHRFLVRFAELNAREEADEARGTRLFGDPIEDPEVLWIHDLINAAVIDIDGSPLGRVVAVEENPASDLLVLDNDSLVPLTFLVERRDGVLVVDPPDGLFDLVGDDSEE